MYEANLAFEGLGLQGHYVDQQCNLNRTVLRSKLPTVVASNIFCKHEYEADRFAKNAMEGGRALIAALQKLYRENLSHPLPHEFLVFFHYSHPTFFERKRALEED